MPRCPERRASRRSPRRFGAAIAACAVFAVAALFAFQSLVPGRYSTGVGEQRTIKLEDGSTIALNTDTAVRVELTDRMRRVSLLRGEALFNVAKDPTRPFRRAERSVPSRKPSVPPSSCDETTVTLWSP